MSSKRQKRHHQCSGKARYLNQERAIRAAMAARRHFADRDLHAYRCQFCGGWHYGHRGGGC